MLQYLKIRNLALIDSAEIDMNSGFTAVTGETGAGKSVLLGALMLLSGARAEKTQIRKKADSCDVEAVLHFDDPERINSCLEEFGLPQCEDGTLLLKRSIFKEKAARIHINNALGTQTALRQIGELWVDFHGPGEHQRLFSERYQLELLDLYAKNAKQLAEYQDNYSELRKISKEIEALLSAEKLGEDDIYFLKSQIESIDALNLNEDSVNLLESDYKRLSNAQKILELLNVIKAQLQSDGGVIEGLMEGARSAAELKELDPSLSELSDRLNASVIEVEDLLNEYSAYSETMDFDEASAEELQQQMNKWLDVKRRYGPDYESVLSKRDALQYKLDTQADVESAVDELRAKAQKIENRLKDLDEKLHQSRLKSSKALCKKVSTLLKALGFQRAKLDVVFQAGTEFTEYGTRKSAYYFQPNAGEDALPLNKIASSGELARVMLAIKTALAELDQVPVLVFDEVDANVGGEVGARVGKELSSLGKKHQVICVTHLPQVAAQAKSHFLINKTQSKSKTDVLISPLHQNEEQRLAEISRMLGDRSSESAIRHAEELLKG